MFKLTDSFPAQSFVSCQTTHDRDENASRNLRSEGIRILSTNTAGHAEIQACGEAVRLVGTCAKKRQCGLGVSPELCSTGGAPLRVHHFAYAGKPVHPLGSAVPHRRKPPRRGLLHRKWFTARKFSPSRATAVRVSEKQESPATLR